MLLSSFIQTCSIQNVLKPFAEKVSELLVLAEYPRQGSFNELTVPANKIRTAVKHLTDAGLEICKSSNDEQFHHEMTEACIQSSKSAAALTREVERISTSASLTSCRELYSAIEGIMEGIIKILLAWDDSEVRRIVRAAQWSHDRLRLVQAAKSMRGLLVCYTGFTESMTLMVQLASQRQKDMSVEHKREKLGNCLAKIKSNLQLLCDSTQNCIRNPSDSVMRETKDEVVECISSAIKEVIEAVKKVNIHEMDRLSEEESPSESTIASETLATNLVKAYDTLSPTNRLIISPQLDIYIKAILKNSKQVADGSKRHYMQAIEKLCEEIKELRRNLGMSLEELQRNPSSHQANTRFNQTADLLCSKFLDLDKLVAQSVADQVAETFVDTSTAINQLLQAVVSSPSVPIPRASLSAGGEGSDAESPECNGSEDLEKNIKLFRRHSLKLSEVAVQAAEGTVDKKSAKQVKTIAGELTDLTSPVVTTALKVRQDQLGHDQLQDLGKQWDHKAQQLKVAVDKIISPGDFTAATEANIAGEMSKCRGAIERQNWVELMSVVQSIAAKGRRVAEVARTTLASMKDPLQKGMVTEALNDLENSVAIMIEQAEYLANHPDDEQAESEFAGSLQEVLTDIQHIQRILPPVTSGTLSTNVFPHLTTDLSSLGISGPKLTSTPISQSPLVMGTGTSTEPLPLLKFSDNEPSPYSVRPITSMQSKDTHREVPMMVDVSTGTQNVDSSVGTRVPKTSRHSVGTQLSDEESVSIGTQAKTQSLSVGTQMDNPQSFETPPTTLPGLYRALSPSDEWIYHASTKETSPSSFAPTNTSPYPSGQEDVDFSEPSSGQSQPRRSEDAVQYPSSLGGLNVTPSLYKMLNTQSDFSLTSDGERKDDHDSHDSDPRYLGTFTQPLQNVLTAADQGNVGELNSYASSLSTRTNRLAKMAETASTAAKDSTLASILQEKSARLAHLTPQIIRQATLKAQDGGEGVDSGEYKDLEVLVHQWTGHVRSLLDASQKANIPWSRTAGRLVTSAKKRSGVDKEIGHITGHTNRMVSVATSSIEAAATEDNIGSTGNLDHEPDPETKDQIEHVQCQIRDIKKITPKFVSTAKSVAEDYTQIAMETEQLNLLSQEWATKANALMRGVDDITIGMSGPADSLLIAASSGDPTLLDEQCRSIMAISLSMMTISEDSVLGCSDAERVDMVLKTARTLQDIAQELVECARELAAGKGEGEEQQVMVERAEILRREWSAKMHLLTAHIDDLTAGVAVPLDRLVSVALQASRTEGMAKDYLMNQFEEKATYNRNQLEVVSSELKEVVSLLSQLHPCLQKCSKAVAFLNKVSPRAIEAARVLSRDPSSAKLDNFSHLRRQWASKAQNFQTNLNNVGMDINVTDVEVAFHDLLQGHKSFRRRSITPVYMEGKRQQRKREGYAKGEEEEITPGSLMRSYSSEDLGPPLGPAPPIPLGETDLGEKTPLSKRPGFSEPSTPHKQDTTPTKVVLRTHKSFTPDLSSKRHISIGVLPSWDGRDDEDTGLNSTLETSSSSIAVAARTLKDTADQFMEEGNPLVALAKKMSAQMYQMSEFARGKGVLQTKSDMIHTAKAVAANAEQIARYANTVSEQCLDERMKASLQSCSDMIPTLSTQLKIIASVKSCNPNDLSADIMLVKNAQNLMQAVIETIQAAEAAYVKGLKPPENPAEFETAALAIEWKRKLYIQRTMETISAPMGAKGLRRLNKKNRFSTPTLSELISPSRFK